MSALHGAADKIMMGSEMSASLFESKSYLSPTSDALRRGISLLQNCRLCEGESYNGKADGW
jgi:hypothetical protein